MTDIAVLFSGLNADFTVLDNDLLTEDGLYSAVVVSLLTDSRAQPTDPLPAGETDRRGWWGDNLNEDPQVRVGSLLWLLQREKATREVGLRAVEYAKAALSWLVDEGIAASVSASFEFTSSSALELSIQISRGSNKNYQYLWDGLKELESQLNLGHTVFNLEFA